MLIKQQLRKKYSQVIYFRISQSCKQENWRKLWKS